METTFTVPPVRAGYTIKVADTACYWFEMDHPKEGHQTLLGIFDQYLNRYNWDKFIRPGSTVVDIGGHSGDTAVPMQFLARGTVLSVEPNPTIKPYLDLACNLNSHLGKFVTANEAVTVTDGETVTIMDHCNSLCNGGTIDPTWTPELQQRMRSMAGDSVQAPGAKLETICKKYLTDEEIANIGFIKTDTEGHDISILESSKDFIDTIRPVIFAEWFFAYTDVENQRLFKVIDDMGYLAFDPTTLEPANINNHISDLLLIHSTKVDEYL